jgi:hypothetical protein
MVLGVIHSAVSNASIIDEQFLLDGEAVSIETGSDMSHHNKMNSKGRDWGRISKEEGILVYIVSLVEEPVLVGLLLDVSRCVGEEYPHFDLAIVDYVSGDLQNFSY